MIALLACAIICVCIGLGAIVAACNLMQWSPFFRPYFRASISPNDHRYINAFEISGGNDEDAHKFRRWIGRGEFSWL
jgi:hypothetical protein